MKTTAIAVFAIALLTPVYAAETTSTAPAEKSAAKRDEKPEVKNLSKGPAAGVNESPLVKAANAANAARAKKKSSIVINDSTIKASKNSEANVTTTESTYSPKFVSTLQPPEVRAANERNRLAAAKRAEEDQQARRDRVAVLRLELARIQADLIDESEDPANNDPEKIERRMTQIQKEIQTLESPPKPRP